MFFQLGSSAIGLYIRVRVTYYTGLLSSIGQVVTIGLDIPRCGFFAAGHFERQERFAAKYILTDLTRRRVIWFVSSTMFEDTRPSCITNLRK